jgi:predicted PurR-regulated permease PerM
MEILYPNLNDCQSPSPDKDRGATQEISGKIELPITKQGTIIMTIEGPILPESPKWSSTTKTIAGLAVLAIIAALLVNFLDVIAPLLLAFILAFLFHPVAAWTSRVLHISWRGAVNVIYLLLIAVLIALITLAGLAIIQQAQSLITYIQNFITGLPQMVEKLSTSSYNIGPFHFDFSQLDLQSLVNQVLGIVQPMLGQAGSLLGVVATSAATALGWGLFIIFVSYFLLSESGQIRENLVHVEIPGYNADIQKFVRKLTGIWDAFFRGQLLISLIVVIAYFFILSVLGVRLALAIAVLAGLARFVPWLGPFVTWTVLAIAAFFQDSNRFGLEPLAYTLLVLGICITFDQIFDYLVAPRILSETLGLHPAGLLVAAIVAAKWLGIIGLVLAAPVLATLLLVGRYVGRKMMDLQPWPVQEPPPKKIEPPWVRFQRWNLAFRDYWQQRFNSNRK